MQAAGLSVQTMFVPFGISVVMRELGKKGRSDQMKQKHSRVASSIFCDRSQLPSDRIKAGSRLLDRDRICYHGVAFVAGVNDRLIHGAPTTLMFSDIAPKIMNKAVALKNKTTVVLAVLCAAMGSMFSKDKVWSAMMMVVQTLPPVETLAQRSRKQTILPDPRRSGAILAQTGHATRPKGLR
jgi:hypothetical protein